MAAATVSRFPLSLARLMMSNVPSGSPVKAFIHGQQSEPPISPHMFPGSLLFFVCIFNLGEDEVEHTRPREATQYPSFIHSVSHPLPLLYIVSIHNASRSCQTSPKDLAVLSANDWTKATLPRPP
eukprot:scaffold578_cov167-Amphora_coffeaeformis.AAC.25